MSKNVVLFIHCHVAINYTECRTHSRLFNLQLRERFFMSYMPSTHNNTNNKSAFVVSHAEHTSEKFNAILKKHNAQQR
jgi:hypothetical protein